MNTAEIMRDSDIRYGDSISISVGVAAAMVDLIGLTEKLLSRQNGQALPNKFRDMRADLTDCLARAAANADVSTKAIAAETVLAFDIDTKTAAEALGISPGGVRWACRTGRLGKKIGDRWRIREGDLQLYRSTYQRKAC